MFLVNLGRKGRVLVNKIVIKQNVVVFLLTTIAVLTIVTIAAIVVEYSKNPVGASDTDVPKFSLVPIQKTGQITFAKLHSEECPYCGYIWEKRISDGKYIVPVVMVQPSSREDGVITVFVISEIQIDTDNNTCGIYKRNVLYEYFADGTSVRLNEQGQIFHLDSPDGVWSRFTMDHPVKPRNLQDGSAKILWRP